MGIGSFLNPIIISICAFFVFFMGLVWFPGLMGDTASFQIYAFIIIFTIIFSLGFFSRHPLNGILISIFITIAFLCGHFTSVATRLLFFSHLWDDPNQYIAHYYENILTFDPKLGSLLGIFSAAFGLASLGLLAGLIGYIFKKISIQPSESYPQIFRDYWSQVYGFKKSQAQEYPKWDRKIAGWSIFKGSWIQRIKEKLREPRRELIFLPKSKNKGELYDVSANKTVGNTELVDYNKLISKYIPKLIHDPRTIANLVPIGKRVRSPPAFRELITKISDDLANSRFTMLFFCIPMLIVVFGPALYWYTSGVQSEWIIPTLLATSVPSITTYVLTYKFKNKSKELLKERPDEGPLVFSIYLCLFLIYPIIIWIAINQPSYFFYNIPNSWFKEWSLGWTLPFLSLSAILGLGYIFIHRETENINVYFFDNRPENVDSRLAPFKKPNEKPRWLDIKEECPDPQNPKETIKVKTNFFWVIRFMYYWRAEITFGLKIPPIFPKFDWERVELWIDAENDVLKWVVSDYHYREAWYKVENPFLNKLPDMFVEICPNFHTPVPIVDYEEAQKYCNTLNASKKELTKKVFEGILTKISNVFRSLFNPNYKKLRKDFRRFLEDRLKEVIKLVKERDKSMYKKVLEKLECSEIRYIEGVEKKHEEGPNKDKYFYETELA